MPTPCTVVAEPAEPDPASVYEHSTDIVAMPAVTWSQAVAVIVALRARVAALANCYRGVSGDVEEYLP